MAGRYDDNVFINCPFSSDYEGLFRALVFAVVDCGFKPRCALEHSDATETRIAKLYRIIRECRLGIHDLSFTELDAETNLPRFNMPLELGIFLGASEFGHGAQQRKSCLILDREQYRYRKFCSDISGQDPKPHGGDPLKAIRCVRNYLRSERPEERLPSGQRMAERFEAFQEDLPVTCEALLLEPDQLEFNDLTSVVEEWLRDHPW